MKILDEKTKFAHLGKPGGTFSAGFQRRLNIFERIIDLEDKKILDIGFGEGVWVNKFAENTKISNIYGIDIDEELVKGFLDGNQNLSKENFLVAKTENLPFQDNFFDIVFSNEVLEHVDDDKKTIDESLRVLKKGGFLIIFTPNRGWPFETHGIFLFGKYIWGNIPLLPWLPKYFQKKFAYHVRNYSNKELKMLFDNKNVSIIHHKHVFPAFDKIFKKSRLLSKLLKGLFHSLEKTPLHYFGISHILIAKKN